jgi:STE24 endopeptidase
VSRVILLVIMATWLIGVDQLRQSPGVEVVSLGAFSVFVAGYLLLVGVMAVWARLLARRILENDFRPSLRRFHWLAHLSRWIIPAWLAFGLLTRVGWGQYVLSIVGFRFQLPGLLLGTSPAMLTWMALWWAEFPADRALREQNVMDELMQDLPVHEPPRFGRYFLTALRQQLLPVVLPVLLIILLRDIGVLIIDGRIPPAYADLAMLPAAAIVYLLSPEILRRLFNARPLEDSPLRRRLEEMCRRVGLRYRDILLWQTDYSMANAAVIGILPYWRYVLLSDRLLETMSDDEIEAVFAHELGHIVHHHMLWLGVFFIIIMLASLGPVQVAGDWVMGHLPRGHALLGAQGDLIGAAAAFAMTIYLMGCLSRRLERQADVFAARMMEVDWASAEATPHVGPRGAEILSSALRRVAFVNNIPLRARDLFHPSIAKRLQYLQGLSSDPARTGEFDRFMSRLYAMLILTLLTCGLVCALRLMYPPVM